MIKKKLTAAKREEMKKQQAEQWRKNKEEKARLADEERKRREEDEQKSNTENPVLDGEKKHTLKPRNITAKKVGVKSVLIIDGERHAMSFGKSDKSILEKKIIGKDGIVEPINNPKAYIIGENDEKTADITRIDVKRAKVFKNIIDKKNNVIPNNTNIKNPLYAGRGKNEIPIIGKDYIGMKDKLEKTIFGDVYLDDNVHVQIAYNILDIKKILGAYVGNVSYAINNLSRSDNVAFDLVGNTVWEYDYNSFINNGKLTNKQNEFETFLQNARGFLPYYRNIFIVNAKSKKGKDADKIISIKEHSYNIIRILAMLRNYCAHFDTGFGKMGEDIKQKDRESCSESCQILIDYTKGLYNEALEKFNNDFLTNAGKNITFLKDKIGDDSLKIEDLIADYYDFAAIKSQKNLGVSVTKLREALIARHYPQVNEEKVTPGANSDKPLLSVIQKINGLFDFAITKYLKSEKGSACFNELQEALRVFSNDEETKQAYYEKYADRVFVENADFFTEDLPKYMSEYFLKDSDVEYTDYKTIIDEYTEKIINNNSEFVAALYVLSAFLDYKEVNDLISNLIEKFSEIGDFAAIYNKNAKKPIDFTESFKMFSNADSIAKELQYIRILSARKNALNDKNKKNENKKDKDNKEKNDKEKSDKENIEINEDVYNAAAQILGFDLKKEYVQDSNGKRVKTYTYKQNFEKIYGKGKGDRDVRNFIKNNVIESSRFFYVIKYCSAESGRKLATCRPLVKLVIDRLPLSQVDRYYALITGTKDVKKVCEREKRDYLITQITGFGFDKIYNSKSILHNQKDRHNQYYKDRMKNLTALYLTVIYLAAKNLVKTNARYYIAFARLDSDYAYINDLPSTKKAGNYYLELTRKFLNDNEKTKHYKKHAETYLKQNLENAESIEAYIGLFRNNILHCTTVTKAADYITDAKGSGLSYFSLFNYIAQRSFFESIGDAKELPEWLAKIKEEIAEHKTYSKDLLKILCMPFAYNLPRYKNLTIEDLFNDFYGQSEAQLLPKK